MTITEIYKAIENKEFNTVTLEIKKLNKSYRDGTPLISDKDYDKLLGALKAVNPENEIFESGVIEEVDSERKEKLKFPMFSLDKDTSIEELHKWLKNKGLPLSTLLVCTAKYDGISVLKNEFDNSAWSRGDGTIGETMHDHYKKLNDKGNRVNVYTIGEMLIPKSSFATQTFRRDNGEEFKNARNMIAGLKNSDTISEDLKYAKHVRYGFASEDFTKNKSEQLDFISKNFIPVPYKVFRADELNTENLDSLFAEWGKEFDIDGLVLDIEDKNIRKSLGRERNNNPAYSRAFKNPEWSEVAQTTLLDIEWNISKQGYLKPVGLVKPVELEGVTVSRVTLNNAKFVKELNIGIGSKILLTRSGGVIPKVIDVIYGTGFMLPKIEGHEVKWNENDVELFVEDTEEQEIKKIISFFEILKTDNVSEGIVNQLYKNGYTTIQSILEMSMSDFEKLEKFGKRKAYIVYTNIKKAITNVNLAKLMHASNMFNGLGSKKLELVCYFAETPTIEQVVKIESFSEISANVFINGYDTFYKWLKTVPQITIETKKEKNMEANETSLEGKTFCFTGIRRKDLEDVIVSKSGKILSGVSKNLTYLVCKDKNSGSSKLAKAEQIGVTLLSIDELEEMLS